MDWIAPEDRCLTLVVAAFNEEEALPRLHPRIRAALHMAEAEGLQARVLYVDDGSRDGTWALLQRFAREDTRVALLRLSRNFGKEAALTAGLDHVERGAVRSLWFGLGEPHCLGGRGSETGQSSHWKCRTLCDQIGRGLSHRIHLADGLHGLDGRRQRFGETGALVFQRNKAARRVLR